MANGSRIDDLPLGLLCTNPLTRFHCFSCGPTCLYWVRQNKVAPSIFCGFLSNCLEFQRNILHTHLVIIFAFNSHISM